MREIAKAFAEGFDVSQTAGVWTVTAARSITGRHGLPGWNSYQQEAESNLDPSTCIPSGRSTTHWPRCLSNDGGEGARHEERARHGISRTFTHDVALLKRAEHFVV